MTLLTPGQQKFAGTFAKETGLDPRVVGSWLLAEQSGSAAKYYEDKGYNNYLNIANTDSGPASGAHSSVWGNPETAARASAQWMKGEGQIAHEYGAPATGIRNILHAAGKGAQSEIQAIAGSGWASSGYNGGNTLRQLYGQISGHEIPVAPGGAAPVVPELKGQQISEFHPKGSESSPRSTGNIMDALALVNRGMGPAGDKIDANWALLAGLYDRSTPINQPPTGEEPKAPLPGREERATGNTGGYVNPIPGFVKGRTDMGVDASAKPGMPIRAVGNAKILEIQPNWYKGQPIVFYELLDGPHGRSAPDKEDGKIMYVAEQIAPEVRAGQEVKAGQKIGTYAQSGTGIETGLGARKGNNLITLAQATTGYSEGQVTKAGQEMEQILHELGVR